MHVKNVGTPLKPMIFRDDHPAMIAVWPHPSRAYFLFIGDGRCGTCRNLDGSALRQSAICAVVQRSPGSRSKECRAMSKKG